VVASTITQAASNDSVSPHVQRVALLGAGKAADLRRFVPLGTAYLLALISPGPSVTALIDIVTGIKWNSYD
jgi:hypothetical protein